MKRLLLTYALVLASPAWSQSRPSASRADPCAPIGRTADGRFVYGMRCENLPAPPPSPRAEGPGAPPPVAVEAEDKGGLFRNPFPSLIKPNTTPQTPGVGPPASR